MNPTMLISSRIAVDCVLEYMNIIFILLIFIWPTYRLLQTDICPEDVLQEEEPKYEQDPIIPANRPTIELSSNYSCTFVPNRYLSRRCVPRRTQK